HGSAINSIFAELSNHEIGTGKTRLRNACVSMLEYKDGTLGIVFYNKSAEELKNQELKNHITYS
ncbi:MAG: histidine phosphatase family protein, partial [Defluviitaleaceae bacterium]|nr:histidine phosphatase family protein [Defluviitaleaceae bacterium]